ncbi:MAG: pyruvate, phosphate dikinase, partial [Candidatus Hydrogenedentota bacterium]
YVYFFSDGKAEGSAKDKNLLGGKGANLAEMTALGLPVPPGFTISTEVCTYFYNHNQSYPPELEKQIQENLTKVENLRGKKLGDPNNPLLVSVRSGAPISMPGMMDTVLNLGLSDASVEGLAKQTNNDRFAWDSYRRFIQMFGNVVMGMEHHDFESILTEKKKEVGANYDIDLKTEDLQDLVNRYKAKVKEATGEDFPQDPQVQLKKAIDAVFLSWNNPRAITYRKLNDIPDDLGTAVNVQSMVFGNMGETSGTGVAFTRNPATGEKKFFGEYLMNAQGEDVVAGIRTPHPIEDLKQDLPEVYNELVSIAEKLEKHYRDMQDLEFTIENGKLYLLQTRNGKRTSFAAVKVAVDMEKEGLISEKEAILRVAPDSLPSLLAKVFDEKQKQEAVSAGKVLAKGLAAGPGAASGKIALSAEQAVKLAEAGEKAVLVREETSPEDISGMHHAEGILTARGGMTSHAAVVARGMNKPCVVGCSAMLVKENEVVFETKNGEVSLKEGDVISIDGFTGEVIHAAIETIPSEIEQVFIKKSKKLEESELAQNYAKLLNWADKYAKLVVRANADTGRDATVARQYGAQGIGLCRTEHMFFEEERILAMRKMILASTSEEREKALAEILPYQKSDFKEIFTAMEGLPVTVRLLDPPLHEFLPSSEDEKAIEELAKELGVEEQKLKEKIIELQEFNPMLGHRGCRLGISYPEITRMQTRAIMEAACELKQNGIHVKPEIMVPLVGHVKELENQRKIIDEVAQQIIQEKGVVLEYHVGTMIEVPRAAVTAHEIAQEADFFSFGTNDLTQLGAGFSRDDSQKFLAEYVELGIYEKNPFQVLDQDGIGELIRIAVDRGRKTKAGLKLGLCGEHGGEPSSIAFCHRIGLNYVSCSPYRVPVARLAAAHAALKN